MGTTAIEASQGNSIQHTKATVSEPTLTCLTDHTTDHPHTAAHQVTVLMTAVDHIHAHPTNHQNIFHTTEAHTVQDLTPTKEPKDHIVVGIEKSI